uniref:Uncharacterized protein n=1 Tax=Aegilops tauschii subsp. strangulata TaxID=200361 RepID=A0A453LML2_AEGTS
AEMPTDLCLFSNSPDPIVPIFGTSSAKVTEWESLSEKGAKNDKRRDSTSLHSCGFLFLGFCFLIRDLAFHGSHLCNSRFSRENQIQVGEDHDLGWHGDRLIDFLDLIAT